MSAAANTARAARNARSLALRSGQPVAEPRLQRFEAQVDKAFRFDQAGEEHRRRHQQGFARQAAQQTLVDVDGGDGGGLCGAFAAELRLRQTPDTAEFGLDVQVGPRSDRSGTWLGQIEPLMTR